MAMQAQLQRITALWPTNSWEDRCINALISSGFFQSNQGLVNAHGQPVSTLANAWGVNITTCNAFCSSRAIPLPVFNFQSFISCLTNYFLPWLTLTAQLPYETGSPWSNIMAFSMAVGSPSLVTFSLTVTIMNKARVRSLFRNLRLKARESEPGDGKSRYKGRIKAAQSLLAKGLQVPLRASHVHGWFTSLVELDKNAEWWTQLDGRLSDTKRGITASLVAQTLLAFLAYLFTVIVSFDSELGNPNTALQIASGSLWTWLIPVIWGWITVGTQARADSIESALTADWARLKQHDSSGKLRLKKAKQKGIIVRSGLNPLPLSPEHSQCETSNEGPPKIDTLHNETTSAGMVNTGETSEDVTTCNEEAHQSDANHELNFPMERLELKSEYGDERRHGPIYNYARIFTSWQLAVNLESALYCVIEDRVDDNRAPRPRSTQEAIEDTAEVEKLLPSDLVGTGRYCGLTHTGLAYPEWSDVWPDVSSTIWIGSLAAAFLQWGTTGASLLIAYQTPTKGLSCRSGSYLVYGTAGTLVWLCLLGSTLLSHEVMLRYQRHYVDHRDTDFRTHKISRGHACLSALANGLRRTGKSLAVFNALWLIVTSIFEFIGMFDNCWCSGDFLGLGSEGWIMIFKNKEDLKNFAIGPWAGGLAITVIVCSISCLCFNLGCLVMKEKRRS